ncbi:HD domain-containing protein, partial [bacterium]
VEAIFFASPMHDIGKIGIPDAVLLKQGRLTNEETGVMRRHTVIGASILHESDSEILKAAEEVARTHHEDWDGSGYPHGLKGEEIPLSGRIVRIVDIYDALRSKRPYKNELDHKTACEIIEKEKYRYDPQIYRAFVACAENLSRLFNAFGDVNGLLNQKLYGNFPAITKQTQ